MANDQEIGKLVLRLVAEVTDLKKGLQSAGDQVKKFTQEQKRQAEGFGASIAGIKAEYLKFAAIAVAAIAIIKKALDWTEMGAKALAVEESFSLITKSMMVNGEALAQKIREVSFVFVDQTDLMVKAQRLLVEGLSSAQIVSLMEASRVAARLMGTDVTNAFEQISEAVLTLRTRGLKAAFPMDVAEVTDRYARSLGTVSKYLNESGQRQAIVNEIIRQTQEKTKLLGGELQPNLSEKIQRVKSAWSEMKEVIGKELAIQVEPVITGLANMITMIEKAQKSWKTLPDVIKEAIREMAVAAAMNIPGVGLLIAGAIRRAQHVEATKTAEERSAEYRERTRQDLAGIAIIEGKARKSKLIDERKLQDDLTKFRLANEEQAAIATGEIQMQILTERKTRSVAAQKATSEDTFLLEQYYDKLIAEQFLRSSLSLLNVKEKMEIEAARQAGMDENSVRLKYVQERYAVIQRFITETGKLEAAQAEMIGEAQRKAVQAERGITPEMEPFAPTEAQMAEMEKRSVDVMAERDRWQAEYLSQLAEVTGDYEGIIAAQTRSLEVEREAFKTKETYWKLDLDQQKQYNDLMDVRIAKARQVRDLENLRDIAEWRREIGELTGNWIMTKDAEIMALEVEREYLLTTKALTPEMKAYVNELYNLKAAEIEARKNMDALGLSVIGFRKYTIQVKNELADTFENVLPNVMKSFWDTFEEYLKRGEWSWRSFADALRSIWANLMRKMAESLVNDLLNTAISGLSQILGLTQTTATTVQGGGGTPGWAGYVGLIGGLIGGLGKSLFGTSGSGISGGTLTNYNNWNWRGGADYSSFGYQKGGPVEGPSGIDAVPIRASAGEFIHSVPAVRHYGESVMAAINARLVPRDILLPYAYEPSSRPAGAFQAGGMVTPGSSISSNVTVSLDNKRDAAMLHAMIERSVISILKEYSR